MKLIIKILINTTINPKRRPNYRIDSLRQLAIRLEGLEGYKKNKYGFIIPYRARLVRGANGCCIIYNQPLAALEASQFDFIGNQNIRDVRVCKIEMFEVKQARYLLLKKKSPTA